MLVNSERLYVASQKGVTLDAHHELFSFGGGKWKVDDPEVGPNDEHYQASFVNDSDVVVIEGEPYTSPTVTTLGSAIRRLTASGMMKLAVCHHDMALQGTTYTFSTTGDLKFVLDTPNKLKRGKVKADALGSKIKSSLLKGVVGPLLVTFRVKVWQKQAGRAEIAPIRPIALLGGAVVVPAGGAVRLF